MGAIVLTEANFEKERMLCNVIFLTYSEKLLNASVNRLISEKHYLTNCMFLHAMNHLVNSYTYKDGVFYLGGIVIPQTEIQQIIDYIHHYYSGAMNISVDQIIASGGSTSASGGNNLGGNTGGNNGSGGSGGSVLDPTAPAFGCIFFTLEITAEEDATHNILVDSQAILIMAFLNGNLVAEAHWTYLNKVFTYHGPVSLTFLDQFALFFKNGCGGTQAVTACQFAPGAGGSLTYVSEGCTFGNATLTQ